jgi:hypothetical protein
LRLQICSKNFSRKSIIRGVVTNKCEWIFFVLKLNKDGNGGNYFQSKGINLMLDDVGGRELTSLIAAIIAHWVGFTAKCDYSVAGC